MLKEIGQQVCNLELAKKLKELGVEQDSLFYYSIGPLDDSLQIGKLYHGWSEPVENISAFLASELLEMLPSELEIEVQKTEDNYIVVSRGIKTHTQYEKDKNLCNALAKMLCYLKENNLLKN